MVDRPSEIDFLPTEEEASIRESAQPDLIAVAFSGGGFRATLFHLGVLLTLVKNGFNAANSIVVGVSGGAVLAASWAANATAFCWPASDESLETSQLAAEVQKLVRVVQCDLRNRVFRRWIAFWVLTAVLMYLAGRTVASLSGWPHSFWNPPAANAMLLIVTVCILLVLVSRGALHGKLADALESQYDDSLFKGASLQDIPQHVYFTATSLTDGSLFVAGNRRIAAYRRGDLQLDLLNEESRYSLARAVSASSAFPPAFPPVMVEFHETDWSSRHYLTDGGVFDNLGILTLRHAAGDQCPWHGAPRETIVSDAAPPLQRDLSKTFTAVIGRNVRASDFLMHRVADCNLSQTSDVVHLEMFPSSAHDRHWPETPNASDLHFKGLASVRTDLDRFTNAEVVCLVEHGASTAFHYLRRRFTNMTQNVTAHDLKRLLNVPHAIDDYRRDFAKESETALRRPRWLNWLKATYRLWFARDWVCLLWGIPVAALLILFWQNRATPDLEKCNVTLQKDDQGNLLITVTDAPAQRTLELRLFDMEGHLLWRGPFDLPSGTDDAPKQATVASEQLDDPRSTHFRVKLSLQSGKETIEEVERAVAIE
jgi:predicted acylesterase/phospholipase RssA